MKYFGDTTSQNAQPEADADGTGQNNLFKFVAGLDPTNPASVFVLGVAPAQEPPGFNLSFSPVAAGRTYTPQYRTNLTFGSYVPLSDYSGPTTNATTGAVTITDTNATDKSRFYRINISLP
jgi:hypothetical protein